MHSVDFKSILIGGLLVALVLCLLGPATYPKTEYLGQYEIETNQDYAFVLDTITGQVWSKRANDNVGNIIDPNNPFYLPKNW
ncbi:hypothetical protein ACFL5F_09390 [Planctomycetota bacterium]